MYNLLTKTFYITFKRSFTENKYALSLCEGKQIIWLRSCYICVVRYELRMKESQPLRGSEILSSRSLLFGEVFIR